MRLLQAGDMHNAHGRLQVVAVGTSGAPATIPCMKRNLHLHPFPGAGRSAPSIHAARIDTEPRGGARSAPSASHRSQEPGARLWRAPRLETDPRTSPIETPRPRYPSLSDTGQPWFKRADPPNRPPEIPGNGDRLPAGPSVGDVSVRMIAILAIAVIMIWLVAVG